MKKEYIPYNFNEKYEYKIYSQIGLEYRKECKGKKRKKNKKMLSFDKYSEWEKYFSDKFLMSDYNAYNFLHYLNEMLRMYQKFEDYFKALVIPVYMALITILLTIYLSMGFAPKRLIFALIVSVIMVIIICMYFLHQYSNRINFYADCLKIINDNYTSHQK